jgi:hypothetical protein
LKAQKSSKPLARLRKREKEHKLLISENERGDLSIDLMNIKRLIEECNK